LRDPPRFDGPFLPSEPVLEEPLLEPLPPPPSLGVLPGTAGTGGTAGVTPALPVAPVGAFDESDELSSLPQANAKRLAPTRVIASIQRAIGLIIIAAVNPATRRDQRALAFLEQFVSQGDLAFDIGASYGQRTSVLRSLGARVVAVEPLPICAESLQESFGSDEQVVVVPAAVAATEGVADLRTNRIGMLSSMSPEWIAATEASGRFDGMRPEWTGTVRVRTTTLDRLIAEHGVPAFCKVDVEGFESEVFAGLSQPIETIAFEYATEARDNLVDSVERLAVLGAESFAFTPAESFQLWQQGWVGAEELITQLDRSDDPTLWGEVWVRALLNS
jgi:FkbM family methyltransferase